MWRRVRILPLSNKCTGITASTRLASFHRPAKSETARLCYRSRSRHNAAATIARKKPHHQKFEGCDTQKNLACWKESTRANPRTKCLQRAFRRVRQRRLSSGRRSRMETRAGGCTALGADSMTRPRELRPDPCRRPRAVRHR